MISCVDSRVFPSKFLCIEPGEFFISRNPGNFVPKTNFSDGHISDCLPAVFDFTIMRRDIKNIVICGHSDCKVI